MKKEKEKRGLNGCPLVVVVVGRCTAADDKGNNGWEGRIERAGGQYQVKKIARGRRRMIQPWGCDNRVARNIKGTLTPLLFVFSFVV